MLVNIPYSIWEIENTSKPTKAKNHVEEF